MTNCSQNFKLFIPLIVVFIIWFSICLNFSSIHFQSRTRRFQMEVLLMPTVGRATDVNMNLFISIPENVRISFKICPLLRDRENHLPNSPCNLSLSSTMAGSLSSPNTLRQRRVGLVIDSDDVKCHSFKVGLVIVICNDDY